MKRPLTCAKAPCKSCPYRQDVPSGVWAKEEYDKLPKYDGSMGDQVQAGGVFMCHQLNDKLCAGWVGTHGADNLLSLRLMSFYDDFETKIDPSVWKYKSPVPLFKSGAEAAAHGMKQIKRPPKRARQTIQQLLRKRKREKKA